MPDNLVILFMFSILASLGIVRFANVLLTHSGLLLPGSSLVELTPYVYFIIHGLPLVVLWLFHRNEPAVVLNAQSPAIVQFIENNGLTAMEAEILKLVIRGASNREIAERNFISPHTVRNHIYNWQPTSIRSVRC